MGGGGGWCRDDCRDRSTSSTVSIVGFLLASGRAASMRGGLLCGGQGVPAEDYCLKWDRERGIFSGTPVTRNIEITGLSCWDLGDRGVLFMGYNKADNSTTDLVADDGSSSSSSFTMKHKIM